MKIKKIIKEIIAAYSGYPDRSILATETKDFLTEFGAYKSTILFKEVLKNTFVYDTHSIERLVLALGQFQAINEKKPYSNDIISQEVINAIGAGRLDQCKKIASAAGRAWHVLHEEIIGYSEAIIKAKRLIWHACFGKELISSLDHKQAIKELNVLILGETGTGKELFAKVIQEAAFWHDGDNKALVASVNVAAFSKDLIDSELFGHKKGAYTGAMTDRAGLIKSAHQGVFFLDEVGDLPASTQVKLLRVIETKKVRPVGSDKETEADVRYISATNKDVKKDNFRDDLYHRLAGTIIHIPPLRERSEFDIEEIARVFAFRSVDKGSGPAFSAYEVLQHIRERNKEGYLWPGNVRELQSFCRRVLLGIDTRASVSPKGTAPEENVPPEILQGQWSEAQLKKWYYDKILRMTHNNITETAKRLGVNTSTLLRRRGKKNDRTSS